MRLAASSAPKRKALGNSELSFLSFSLGDLLARVRRDFPELEDRRIEAWLVRQRTLACINIDGEVHQICIHAVLNHAGTPEEVIAFVLRHELLHLQIPPREIDGKLVSHPPEFWEAERALAKDGELAWAWIWLTFHSVLKHDKKNERTVVKRNWRGYMDCRRMSMSEMVARFGWEKYLAKGDGAVCM